MVFSYNSFYSKLSTHGEQRPSRNLLWTCWKAETDLDRCTYSPHSERKKFSSWQHHSCQWQRNWREWKDSRPGQLVSRRIHSRRHHPCLHLQKCHFLHLRPKKYPSNYFLVNFLANIRDHPSAKKVNLTFIAKTEKDLHESFKKLWSDLHQGNNNPKVGLLLGETMVGQIAEEFSKFLSDQKHEPVEVFPYFSDSLMAKDA